jgi:hypothetical protein
MNLVRFRHLAVPAVLLAAGTASAGRSPAGDDAQLNLSPGCG